MATPGKQVKLTTALGFRSFKSCLTDFRMLIPRGEKEKEEKIKKKLPWRPSMEGHKRHVKSK